jgi:hypothetical protein
MTMREAKTGYGIDVLSVGRLLDALADLPRDTKIKLSLGTALVIATHEVKMEGPALTTYTALIRDRDGWFCIGGCLWDDLTEEELRDLNQ